MAATADSPFEFPWVIQTINLISLWKMEMSLCIYMLDKLKYPCCCQFARKYIYNYKKAGLKCWCACGDTLWHYFQSRIKLRDNIFLMCAVTTLCHVFRNHTRILLRLSKCRSLQGKWIWQASQFNIKSVLVCYTSRCKKWAELAPNAGIDSRQIDPS